MNCLCKFLFLYPYYSKVHTIGVWLLGLLTTIYEPTIILCKFKSKLFTSFILCLLFKLDYGHYRLNFLTFYSMFLHTYWTLLTTDSLLVSLSLTDPWDTCDNSDNELRSWFETISRYHWDWAREKIFECSLKNRANFYKYFCIKNQ